MVRSKGGALPAGPPLRTLGFVTVTHEQETSGVPALPIRRLTVAQYDAIAAAGILEADDRIELLDGLLVEKMTKNPPHRIATRRIVDALTAIVPSGWYVDSQEPIVTSDSEPEPDGAVIAGDTGDYADANPPASAVALVVEVADDSLVRDRATKGSIYARARIPTYWIVNLADRCVEVYTDPLGEGPEAHYSTRLDHRDGAIPLTIGGATVGVVHVATVLP